MINLNGTTTGYGANTAELANVDIRLGNSAVPINGLYSPAANQLAISTGGTGRLFIASDGKVGIGTSSPAVALDVAGGISGQALNATGSAVLFSSAGGGVLYHNGSGTAVLRAYSNVSGAAGNLTFNASGSENARIDSSGRLLVGTTSDPGGIGSQLAVSSATDAKVIINTTGSTNRTELHFRNSNANGEARIVNNTSGPLVVYRNATTEGFRLDSSGRLLVGTSTALTGSNSQYAKNVTLGNSASATGDAFLAIGRGSVGTGLLVDRDVGKIVFTDNAAAEFASIGCATDAATSASDYPGRLVFSTTADGASSTTEAMRINNQRELLIGTTTRTANGGVLQVSNGITFPGTQSACSDPNTLDDYEEGTWTPTVIGTSTTGTGTYTNQAGIYQKVGNLVTIHAKFAWSNHTGSGDLSIGGLPFTTNGTYYSHLLVASNQITLTAGNTMAMGQSVLTTSRIGLYQSPTGGGAIVAVPLDTAGDLYVGGSYFI